MFDQDQEDLAYINHISSTNNKKSTKELSPDKLFSYLKSVDILRNQVRGQANFDNRDDREESQVRHMARGHIMKADDKGFAFWQIFEAVYKTRITQNDWTGDLFIDGRLTNEETLLDQLETSLEMLSKLSKEQFDRKLEVFLTYQRFNPVRQELEAIARSFTKTETVTSTITESDWYLLSESDSRYQVGQEITEESEIIQQLPDWDRLASILFGADDDLSQKMLEKWLVALVARAMLPGCQADNCLVLKGNQGIGKSSFFRLLGGDYFNEMDGDSDPTEFKRILSQSWVIELNEIESITRKKEVEALKAFLTKTKDTYRGLYERKPKDHPRHVAFGGSCNSDEFLKDKTGNRRFWVIPCSRAIDLDYLKVNREAILAHAYRLWQSGFSWQADSQMFTESEERNKEYLEANEFTYPVSRLVAALVEHMEVQNSKPRGKDPDRVAYDGLAIAASDLLTYGLNIPLERHRTNRNDRKVAEVLTELGYIKSRSRVDGQRVYSWMKEGTQNPYLVTPQDIKGANQV